MSDLVLGISAFYHDSAAAIVADGVPAAAAQQGGGARGIAAPGVGDADRDLSQPLPEIALG